MGRQETVTIRTARDKHRFRCPTPYRHADWRVWDGKFSCQSCRRLRDNGVDVETTYDRLWDVREARYVTRADLEIAHDGLLASQ